MVITKEQLEERRNYIGASDVAAIVGLSPYGNQATVWLQKVKGATRKYTDTMQRGNDLEPAVLRWGAERVAHKTGVEVRSCVENGEYAHRVEGDAPIVCHLDGLLRFSDGTQAVLEAKTTRLEEDYGSQWTDEVPPAVLCQVMIQMALAQVKKAYVAVLGRENNRMMFQVDFQEDIWKALLDECNHFWFSYVVPKVRPTGDVSLELLERIDRHDEDNALELEGEEGESLLRVVSEWENKKQELLNLKKEVEGCRMAVLEMMGDHSVVRTTGLEVQLPTKGRKVLKVMR